MHRFSARKPVRPSAGDPIGDPRDRILREENGRVPGRRPPRRTRNRRGQRTVRPQRRRPDRHRLAGSPPRTGSRGKRPQRHPNTTEDERQPTEALRGIRAYEDPQRIIAARVADRPLPATEQASDSGRATESRARGKRPVRELSRPTEQGSAATRSAPAPAKVPERCAAKTFGMPVRTAEQAARRGPGDPLRDRSAPSSEASADERRSPPRSTVRKHYFRFVLFRILNYLFYFCG